MKEWHLERSCFLIARISSFTQLPILAGISPNIMFSVIFNSCRFMKFPTSMGRTPVNLLADKSRKISENKRLKTLYDMVPLRLLLARFKTIIFWHIPRLKGMLPWRLLASKYKSIKRVKFPREQGMFPKKLFWDKTKYCNFLIFPI